MKKISKTVALFLVVVMTIIELSIAITADEKKSEFSEYNAGSGYVAFGDSFTRGMGVSEDWENTIYYMDDIPGNPVENFYGEEITASVNCRNVEGTYCKMLANLIGCYCPDDITDSKATYWPIAQNGLTSYAIADLMGLDDDYYDTVYTHHYKRHSSRYVADLYYFGNQNSVNADGVGTYGKSGVAMDILTMVDSAKLITIELGMSDIMNRMGNTILDLYAEAGSDLNNPAVLSSVVKTVVSQMYEQFHYWEKDYQLILDYIKEHNPEATVVMLGAENPVFNATLSDDMFLPVGTALSTVTMYMNQIYRKWAKEYNYIYVDISNVELEGIQESVSLSNISFDSPDTHPTPEGQKQIFRMIVSALKEQGTKKKNNADHIVVDLGRFSDVDYVLVNGIPTQDYTVENSVLTIPSRNHNAVNLTVGMIVEGKLSITTYELVYRNGYTAYRIYTVNNAANVLQKLHNSAKSTASKVLSLFQK